MDASRPSAPPPSPLLRASEVLLKYLRKPPTSSSSWDLLPQVLPQVLSWPSASAYRISSAVVMSRGSRVQLVRRAPRDCPPRAKIRAGFFLPQTSFEARSRLSSLVHGVTSRRRPLTRLLDLDGVPSFRVPTLRTFSAGSLPLTDRAVTSWRDGSILRRIVDAASGAGVGVQHGLHRRERPDGAWGPQRRSALIRSAPIVTRFLTTQPAPAHARRRSSGSRTTCFTRSR